MGSGPGQISKMFQEKMREVDNLTKMREVDNLTKMREVDNLTKSEG